MLLCIDGRGGQICGDRCVDMRAGNLFYFPAGMRHCSAFYPGHEFNCYVIDIERELFAPAVPGDREMLDVLASMAACRGPIPLSAAGYQRVHELLADLYQEFLAKSYAYHAITKATIMQMLIAITRDPSFKPARGSAAGPPGGVALIEEVIAYIDGFYMNDITVDAILKFCPLSRSRFHTLFKQATGQTCISHLKKKRIEEAKKLLLTTDLQAAEIAHEVGFNSPTYFSNVFRQETGVSPGAFRGYGVR
jgi:AraC-like DNA-binding protein